MSLSFFACSCASFLCCSACAWRWLWTMRWDDRLRQERAQMRTGVAPNDARPPSIVSLLLRVACVSGVREKEITARAAERGDPHVTYLAAGAAMAGGSGAAGRLRPETFTPSAAAASTPAVPAAAEASTVAGRLASPAGGPEAVTIMSLVSPVSGIRARAGASDGAVAPSLRS